MQLVPPPAPDPVNHPAHYTAHPSGIECIEVVEHMGFNLGNAIKYLWRADEKGNALEDLRKAAWYVQREIDKRSIEAERAADRGDTGRVHPAHVDDPDQSCGAVSPEGFGTPPVCHLPANHYGPHCEHPHRTPTSLQWWSR